MIIILNSQKAARLVSDVANDEIKREIVTASSNTIQGC